MLDGLEALGADAEDVVAPELVAREGVVACVRDGVAVDVAGAVVVRCEVVDGVLLV